MGFDPIIANDGTWTVGTNNYTTFIESYFGRPAAFTSTGSATLQNNTWFRVWNTNVFPTNAIFLISFEWSSNGAPWRHSSAFLYSTIGQNGDATYAISTPQIVHADNGTSFLTLYFRAGSGWGGAISGLEFKIENRPGQVGSWTAYAYNLGWI